MWNSLNYKTCTFDFSKYSRNIRRYRMTTSFQKNLIESGHWTRQTLGSQICILPSIEECDNLVNDVKEASESIECKEIKTARKRLEALEYWDAKTRSRFVSSYTSEKKKHSFVDTYIYLRCFLFLHILFHVCFRYADGRSIQALEEGIMPRPRRSRGINIVIACCSSLTCVVVALFVLYIVVNM